MHRGIRSVGMAVAVILMVSAGAHSLGGWPALTAELAPHRLPADLVAALQAGWHFGGMMMLATGVVVLRLLRSPSPPRARAAPLGVVGVGYLCFGLWAMLRDGFRPFFLLFAAPGALLLLVAVHLWSAAATEPPAP